MRGSTDRRRLVAAAVLAVVAAGSALAADARSRLARIPKTDRARFESLWHREWRNPRVVVDRDAVYVLLGGKGLGEDAKPVTDVVTALASLPRREWPYGRIVALTRTPRLVDDEPVAKMRAQLDEIGVETIETPVGCNCTN